MERLTEYGKTSHENKVCCTHFMGKECIKHAGHCSDNCLWEEATWSKLAAYEDTGLEPEEIDILKKYHDFNTLEDANASKRLCELAQADRDGRCVVLKCKHGDTVWFIKSAFSIAHFPIEAVHVSIRGIDCDGDVMYAAITTYNRIERRFKNSDIGKTVFLTREEAEKALEGKTNE